MNRPDAGDPRRVATWSDLTDREPAHARVEGVDLVVVRYDGEVSVLYGRCLHRGVLLGDGRVDGHNLICGVHGWDYRVDTGISEYDNSEVLEKFTAWVDEGEDAVFVDAAEVAEWAEANPQPYDEPEAADSAANPEFYGDLDEDAEPHTHYIQKLAQRGAEGIGEHGSVSAMGVPRSELPSWDDLQILTAQLARTPLDDEAPVDTELVIGPSAENPLALDIPIFVSDMSFGALSEEAKIAISEGAERAGTGVCSGEGGMLPEEQAANSRYFYEYATGEFGWDIDLVERVQAFGVGVAGAADVEEEGVRVRAAIPVDEPVVAVPAVVADEPMHRVEGVPVVSERHPQVLHARQLTRCALKSPSERDGTTAWVGVVGSAMSRWPHARGDAP